MEQSMKTQEMQRSNSAARVATVLRDRIAQGVYAPHSFLPAERQLAEELRTGRRSLRLALASLVREGLVVRSHGRGARVVPPLDRLTSNCTVGIAYLAIDATQDFQVQETHHLLAGIQSVLGPKGYRHETVLLHKPAEPSQHLSEKLLPLADLETLADRYGALLLLESLDAPEGVLKLMQRGVPLVVANLEDALDVPATRVEHRTVMLQAVRTLTGLGHRRIAFLGRTASLCFYGEALEGYKMGLAEAGIAPDTALIMQFESRRDSLLTAYLATRRLLELDAPPTGIVAARDMFAGGACRAIEEAGMVVGRDVSVIGYDDLSWPQAPPFLTTFREPAYEMGRVAAEMLVERIVHPGLPIEQRVIEAPLIVRRSAGPLVHADPAPR